MLKNFRVFVEGCMQARRIEIIFFSYFISYWSGVAEGLDFFLVGIITLGDVLNGLGSRLDLVSVLVGDLDRELLLDGHDHLDSVQRVQAEIRVEVGLEGDLCLHH